MIWDVASGEVQSQPGCRRERCLCSNQAHRASRRRPGLAFDPIRQASGNRQRRPHHPALGHRQRAAGRHPPLRQSSYFTSLAFSPDGASWLPAVADRSLTLWDLSSYQPVGKPLAGSPGVILSLGYDPQDSKILFSGDYQRQRPAVGCRPRLLGAAQLPPGRAQPDPGRMAAARSPTRPPISIPLESRITVSCPAVGRKKFSFQPYPGHKILNKSVKIGEICG